jgi:hypothetical protein
LALVDGTLQSLSNLYSLDIYGKDRFENEQQILLCLFLITADHRHLSNIDCLIACTACLVCFISTVNGRNKKRENALEDVALVAGTQPNLSNLYSLDIYAADRVTRRLKK